MSAFEWNENELNEVNMKMVHLHKHAEKDDGDGGGDEKLLHWKVVHEEHQREADCPSHATVGDDELIPEGHGVAAHLIDHGRQE